MNIFSLILSIAASFFAPDSAEIVFVGDAMQHERQLNAARQSDGSFSFKGYYDAIEPYISSADLSVVNLELPLGGKPYSGYPMFCAPDSFLYELKNAGFDYILTANNHSLDRRDKGVKRTLDVIDAAGLKHTGTFRNKAERDSLTPSIVDVNGFKVAFLNYTYGTNGIKVQNDVVVNYINRDQMRKDVKKARENGAELVAVCIHWGIEYVLLPNKEQRQLADFLSTEGVDLIIGGHPHVIQPMEMRQDNRTKKKTLVVYSLGNFVSAMRKEDTIGGAMIRVKLKRNEKGEALIDTATYRLVIVQPPSTRHENYQVLPAEGNITESLKQIRGRFVKKATDIFNRHNVNVPLDTIPIDSYNREN